MGSGDFVVWKNDFFSQDKTLEVIDSESVEFPFVSENQGGFGQEFDAVFSSLKKQAHPDIFWIYCYQCCYMLETYYSGHDELEKAAEYGNLKQQIRTYREQGVLPSVSREARTLKEQLVHDLSEISRTPWRVSKLHAMVSFANLLRIQIIFSRITVEQSLLVARQFDWFSALDRWLGRPVDAERMVSSLRSLNGVFNGLSVGLFVGRFILNAGVILKHTFNPSEAEQSLSASTRFFREVKEKHCEIINDVLWTIVNGVTNYAPYFGISAPAANWILSGFLLFDAGFLMYRRDVEYQRYVKKKAQLEAEINEPSFTFDQRAVSSAQLEQLTNQWQVTSAVFYFNVGAALLLFGGFSASLLLSTAAAPLCFFTGAVAVSMYLTSPLYKTYQEQCLTQSQENIETARADLLIALTKNTVMPMLLLTTLAASLPAGVLLTSLFLGYEYWKDTASATAPSVSL